MAFKSEIVLPEVLDRFVVPPRDNIFWDDGDLIIGVLRMNFCKYDISLGLFAEYLFRKVDIIGVDQNITIPIIPAATIIFIGLNFKK